MTYDAALKRLNGLCEEFVERGSVDSDEYAAIQKAATIVGIFERRGWLIVAIDALDRAQGVEPDSTTVRGPS